MLDQYIYSALVTLEKILVRRQTYTNRPCVILKRPAILKGTTLPLNEEISKESRSFDVYSRY